MQIWINIEGQFNSLKKVVASNESKKELVKPYWIYFWYLVLEKWKKIKHRIQKGFFHSFFFNYNVYTIVISKSLMLKSTISSFDILSFKNFPSNGFTYYLDYIFNIITHLELEIIGH